MNTMNKMRLWLKYGIAGAIIYSALLLWAIIAYPKLDNLAVIYTPWLLSGLTGINFYEPSIAALPVFTLWALINYAAIFGIFAGIGLIASSAARVFRKSI